MKPAWDQCAARAAVPGDLDEIAGLLQQVFGVPRHVEALRRKYASGSNGGLNGSAVLTAGARIAGFLGQVTAGIRIAGRDFLAAQGADVAILEEYRRLDSFMKLVQCSIREMQKAGVAVTYGTPNENALALAGLLGSQIIAPIPLVVRPLRAGAVSQGRRVTGLIALALASVADRIAPGALPAVRVEQFDGRFDRFWRKIADDYPVQIARNALRLNRRYAEGQASTYERIAVVDGSGEIAGFAVLTVRRHDSRTRGSICELAVPKNGGNRVARSLISAAVAWFKAQRADVADTWAFQHTHVREPLVCMGFVPNPMAHGGFQTGLLEAGEMAGLSAVRRRRNWFVSPGDSDTM
jgi:hypothetical protein